jgi:hypothetical protein
MVSLWAYVRYAQRIGAAWVNLAVAFVGLALSLMAKQTLVTLPFVFLLLDLWPLGRMQLAPTADRSPTESNRPGAQLSFGRFIYRFIPSATPPEAMEALKPARASGRLRTFAPLRRASGEATPWQIRQRPPSAERVVIMV